MFLSYVNFALSDLQLRLKSLGKVVVVYLFNHQQAKHAVQQRNKFYKGRQPKGQMSVMLVTMHKHNDSNQNGTFMNNKKAINTRRKTNSRTETKKEKRGMLEEDSNRFQIEMVSDRCSNSSEELSAAPKHSPGLSSGF